MNKYSLMFLFGVTLGLSFACFSRAARERNYDNRPKQYIRPAGRSQMQNPPKEWDMVDEQGDESFPASDPPGNY